MVKTLHSIVLCVFVNTCDLLHHLSLEDLLLIILLQRKILEVLHVCLPEAELPAQIPRVVQSLWGHGVLVNGCPGDEAATGRAASGGALAPEPPRATRSEPEPIRNFSPKHQPFFSIFRDQPIHQPVYL